MHDLSLYLLELIENSARAQARRITVGLHVDRAGDSLRLSVEDDGCGLGTAPQDVLDPFYTTKEGKKTGLGLSLLGAEAEASGGSLVIGPAVGGAGVRVEVEMALRHVDRPPVGDIYKTLKVMAVTNPDIVFSIDLTGDEFNPPLIGLSLEEARDPLRLATHQLDRVAIGESPEETRD